MLSNSWWVCSVIVGIAGIGIGITPFGIWWIWLGFWDILAPCSIVKQKAQHYHLACFWWLKTQTTKTAMPSLFRYTDASFNRALCRAVCEMVPPFFAVWKIVVWRHEPCTHHISTIAQNYVIDWWTISIKCSKWWWPTQHPSIMYRVWPFGDGIIEVGRHHTSPVKIVMLIDKKWWIVPIIIAMVILSNKEHEYLSMISNPS